MTSGDLAKLVTRLRLRADWTQVDLATRAGVTPATICNLEADGKVNVATLLKVCAALNLDLTPRLRGPHV